MCHRPYRGDSGDVERYSRFRPVDEGMWLLHGHVHDKWRREGRMINVGVDVWDFTPASERDIIALIQESQVTSG
jgi:calcineurin-like phosphoesterase family protein